MRVQREPEHALRRWRRRRAEVSERELCRRVISLHLHRHLQRHVAAGAPQELHCRERADRGARAAAPAVARHPAARVAHVAALQARERRELGGVQATVVRER